MTDKRRVFIEIDGEFQEKHFDDLKKGSKFYLMQHGEKVKDQQGHTVFICNSEAPFILEGKLAVNSWPVE